MLVYGFGKMYSQSDSNDVYWDSTISPFRELQSNSDIKSMITTNDSAIIIGGYLLGSIAESLGLKRIIIYKEGIWSSLNKPISEPNGIVNCLLIKNNELYVAGNFDSVGNKRARSITKWNGSSWDTLGGGVNGVITSMKIFENQLYVAGRFDSAGNIKAKNIASWNGTNWIALGKGIRGIIDKDYQFKTTEYVNTMLVSESNLFVAGVFDSAGEFSAKNISKWNGVNWSAIGGGLNGPVNCIEKIGKTIFIGGEYDTINSTIRAISISKWDSVNGWANLGTGPKHPGIVGVTSINSMKSVNGKLYIGGYFTSISDTIANYIAIWNGSKWGRLGSGLDDAPYSIEVGKTGLFVSGSFRKAGNINSSAIAKWRLEKDTTNNGYIKSIDKPQIDRNQKLKENFPQPFKEETKFYVNLEEPKEVTISVLNDKGQLIEIIFKGLIEGEKEFKWSGKGESNGIYYYRITGNGIDETKKFVLVK